MPGILPVVDEKAGTIGPRSGSDGDASRRAPARLNEDWPAHTSEVRPWKQAARQGPREDRMVTEVTVSLPPLIAEIGHNIPGHLWPGIDQATAAVGAVDAHEGFQLPYLETFLLRTEAVSSSRIERHVATLDDIARATIGVKSSKDGQVTVAAARAMSRLVESVTATDAIETEQILAAHEALMKHDATDWHYAGRWRDVQNWIGGSDYSPRGAVHVPPPPEIVPEYMDDLVAYVNREDLPALVQASVAHAQFESIHPFTDGNGRIGRALINAIFRRRGLHAHSVVPVASAMVADVNHYFDLVNRYRDGDVWSFVEYLARSSRTAATQARVSARRLAELPTEWETAVSARRGSAAHALVGSLLEQPVFDAEMATKVTGATESNTYAAIDRLVHAQVVHQIGESKRNRVWAATDILNEMESLTMRLHDTST